VTAIIGIDRAASRFIYSRVRHFYKNLVMAGGFLYVIAFGPIAINVDEGMTAR
jgi:uncharacterized membrane protein YphA (DoxX/SURF4 family)